MAPSEDQLCGLFADSIKNSNELVVWLLSKTKFAPLAGKCRLLHEEQASIRPRRHWWRHWWCHVPELAKDRETDIFMVFEVDGDRARFAIHIECKKDGYRFSQGQAASYAPRARYMLAKAEFLGHSDYETVLLAPQPFRDRYAEEAACFDSFIAFEEVATFLPEFAKKDDKRRLPPRERAARADISEARNILARAGQGNPPLAGDEVPD